MPRLSPVIKTALVGLIGALALVSLLSRQDISLYALDFTISLQIFDLGYTVIDLPPLGTVRARTHQLPLMFRISLKNVNLDRLGGLVAAQQPETVLANIEQDLRQQITVFLVRVLMVAFVGGFGAGYFYFRRGRAGMVAGLAGLVLFAVLVLTAVATYDDSAFLEPEFEGIIEVAPWLLGVAEEALAVVEELDAMMKVVTDNLALLFESLRHLGPGSAVEGELKILHVSDIHNNPVAITLIGQMVAAFDIDLIIDTGDITDYGTPLEAELAAAIGNLGLPYIFVPGNHDSPAVLEALGALDNVLVADGVVRLDKFDLLVAGIGDPAAEDTAMAVRPRQQYLEAARALRDRLATLERTPDIIAAHHVWIVQEFTDLPVLLLHGHSHRVYIRRLGKAVVVDSGTTGGAGIRGLMTRDELPYSMVLLHMDRGEEGWQPVAADTIKVFQLNAGFTLERQLLTEPMERRGE